MSLRCLLPTLCVLALSTAAAAQTSPAHTHVGHVRTSFAAAPGAQGLLPLAIAEARTAAQHAELAGRDPANLNAMKTHAAHVLHALDPAADSQGPGQGFGAKRAAEGVVAHIELAAGAAGASDNVRTHAGHIAASARTAAGRADEAAALARRIAAAGTSAEAAPLVERLAALTAQILAGQDANGDGRVTWEAGEGGLEQADQHLGLLARGEGL
jgi:hypothetical protein